MMEELDPEGRYPVKALLPFLGKRVIDWQVEALRASPYIGEIYLLGLSSQEAPFDMPINYVPVDITLDFHEKLKAGLEYTSRHRDPPEQVIISSSDAPGVTTKSVNGFLAEVLKKPDYDLVISLVPEEIAKAVFPDPGRVVGRFRDHRVFPGELYALSARAIREGQPVIREIHGRRRSINREAGGGSLMPILGYLARRPKSWLYIAKYLMGWATLADGIRAVSLTFDCKVDAVLINDPGFGMDMDLPEDYEKLKDYISQRHRSVNQLKPA